MTDLTVFLSDLAGGGAERVMLNIAEGFADRGYRVDLVLVRRWGPYLDGLSPRLSLIHLAVPRLYRSLPELVAYLRRVRPRVLVSALDDTNLVAIVAGACARVDTRILVTEHCHVSENARYEGGLKGRLRPWLVRHFYNHADGVIAVSRGVEADLHHLGVSSTKTRTIYNPIVTPALRRQLASPPDHPWLVDNGIPVILGIGRLCPQKNFSLLIQAFAAVKKDRDTRLMILGDGEDRSALERLIETLGIADSVALPGFVSNPVSYLTRAAVLALSSRWEGFGNVLVEALAAGTPVVSTDCRSGPAEIISDPRYGRLVPMDDIPAMARAILEVLAAPPPDKQVLKSRAETFALAPILDQYAEVFFP